MSTPTKPVAPAASVRILFLGANPSNTTRLSLSREVREIEERLHASKHRDAFRIEQAGAVRATDLQACLLRYRPLIVHFSGHGNSAGELLFEDETGFTRPIAPIALGNLFRVLRKDIRCVLLNACFSEAQARALAENIDCVIGMTAAVDDRSAVAFAGAFYQALGFGEDVQTAFDLGCNQMDLARAQSGPRDLEPEAGEPGAAHAEVPRLFVKEGVRAQDIRFAKVFADPHALSSTPTEPERELPGGVRPVSTVTADEASSSSLDEFTFERSIQAIHREQALLVGEVLAKEMLRYEYPESQIKNSKLVYTELTRNGIEHGCSHPSDSITVKICVTRHYASISVFNPPERVFDLASTLGKQEQLLRAEPRRRRGRGLLMARQAAEDLEQLNDHSIKATISRHPPASVVVHQFEGVTVVRVDLSGSYTIRRWEIEQLRGQLRGDVLLHMVTEFLDSSHVFVVGALDEYASEASRKFVAAIPSRDANFLIRVMFDDPAIYRSFRAALRAIATPEVADVVYKRYKRMYPKGLSSSREKRRKYTG